MGKQRTEVRCSACDAVVTQTAQHCRRCGESFKEPSCPNPKCGAKHTPGDRFCDKCGTSIPEETPHAHKVTVQVEEPYRLRELAIALYCAIGGGILISIWCLARESQRIDSVAGRRGLSTLVEADVAAANAYRWMTAAWLVMFVLLIVWAWRATRNLQNWGAPVKWRPGWAIGGWFIPVGMFWIPYQVIRDAWRLALAPNESLPARRLGIWLASWLGFVTMIVLRQSATYVDPETTRWSDIQNSVRAISSIGALANVVWIISAVGLMMTVHRISTRQDELATLKR